MNDIYISMPALNDYEYLNTIEKAFDEAKNPDKIKIGSSIFWKEKDIHNDKIPFFYLFDKKIKKISNNINYDILYYFDYPGVGHGRTESLKHFNNEKYYLSLDSHTHFSKDWDVKAIDLYENSKKEFGKLVILTSYLPSYYNNNGDIDFTIYRNNFPGLKNNKKYNVHYVKDQNFSKWPFFDYYGPVGMEKNNFKYFFPTPNDKDLDLNSPIFNNLIMNQYIPAKKISAHFTFTESHPWITRFRICLDPNITFWAEEFYQSVLSYARGYNFVWIKDPLFFHLYGREENGKKFSREIPPEKLDSISDKEMKKKIFNKYIYKKNKYQNLSLDIDNYLVKSLLNKKNYYGYLPRDPRSFLKYSGIDLYNQKCSNWWEVPELNVVFK